jgi:peptidoglycan hydrolase-like protein with peptidoglycan-binding domain
MPLVAGRFAANPRLQQVAENNPPMKQGERGEAVAIVQQALVDLGFAMPVTTNGGRKLADGIFGNETTRVVNQFQMANQLGVDGTVGRNTMAALDRLIQARSAVKQSETAATRGRDFTLKTAKSDDSLA